MNDISIGAVGAAIIAGLVSLLGLIIGKEQKISEFRQVWIDDLRKCIITYLACINTISDTVRLKKSNDPIGNNKLVESYKQLNEASYGITLRINSKEKPAQDLIGHMKRFEAIAENNSKLTPNNIFDIENDFINSSKDLLKFEWKRVKRGEPTFVAARYIIIATTILMIIILTLMWNNRKYKIEDQITRPGVQSTQQISNQAFCPSESPPASKPAARRPASPHPITPEILSQPKEAPTCASDGASVSLREAGPLDETALNAPKHHFDDEGMKRY